MTSPAHTHQAIISADVPPRSACGDSGPSTARAADVTCPACLDLAADRKARTEPVDEILPGRVYAAESGEILIGVGTDAARMLVRLDGERLLWPKAGPLRLVGMIPASQPAPVVHDSCPSCPHCGETFHVEDAPAKTHDLTVDRGNGNVVITVEGVEGEQQVYLQEGVALDLGRVLEPLTPAQRQLLIDDLTGGEK